MGKIVLDALHCKSTPYTPIWVMRQAGRYLPEYRALRAKAGSFMNLCTNPSLAAEVTLMPFKHFDLDAAIVFSDILTIPDAMGLGLSFKEKQGPVFDNPLKTPSDIAKLVAPDVSDSLNYVYEAIALTKKNLAGHVTLLGFAGSPWTLATYMVEGGSTKTFSQIKKLMYSAPESLKSLLDILAKSTIQYLSLQIKAGAEAVMIFDTWGGVLSADSYTNFSFSYLQQIVDGLRSNVDTKDTPIILFTKGAQSYARKLKEAAPNAIGLDWTSSIRELKDFVGPNIAVQGNLDPAILYAPKPVIKQNVESILQEMTDTTGHIFNLGHGILPDVPPENLAYMLECVRNFNAA